MIGGLKLKEGDAEQPLLGPCMLSTRVNVLKCEKCFWNSKCADFSDNFWIPKIEYLLCEYFLQ